MRRSTARCRCRAPPARPSASARAGRVGRGGRVPGRAASCTPCCAAHAGVDGGLEVQHDEETEPVVAEAQPPRSVPATGLAQIADVLGRQLLERAEVDVVDPVRTDRAQQVAHHVREAEQLPVDRIVHTPAKGVAIIGAAGMVRHPLARDPFMPDYKVADITLADFGRREIALAEAEMPALMALRRKYEADKPLAGAKDHRLHPHDHPDCRADPHADGARCRGSLVVLQHFFPHRTMRRPPWRRMACRSTLGRARPSEEYEWCIEQTVLKDGEALGRQPAARRRRRSDPHGA